MSDIPRRLRSFMNAVSNSDDDGILKHLAPDSDLRRFYRIFGCDPLRLMLNRIPGDNLRIGQLSQNGDTAQAVLCSLDMRRWSTVLLREAEGLWLITDAFPVKMDDSDDPAQLSEEIRWFLSGSMPISIDCRDADLTRFLRDVHRQARKLLTCESSNYRGKISSIFEMTEYLWTRKVLWSELQERGYDAAVYNTTINNDIYVGVEKHSSRRIAIKLLRNTTPRIRENFLNEMNILSSLRQHACVPPILFSATVDGFPYFGSDWAPGNLLDDEIQKSPGWSIRERMLIMINIVRAILDIRAHNVIHRDMATDHVFVRDDLEVSIIDFGMASFIHRMDPERLRVAHLREIRNLGLIACYLLIENPRPLFGSACRYINGWAAALDRLRATDLSRDLIKIVERAVAADPECRSITLNIKLPYNEIEELLTDIERAYNLL